jgi:2-polyprenyl-3-methyl-5-hydroxy-6-metoxy-1,4-benzoquinol methylase
MPTATVNHLDYYRRHGINPVRYEMADLRRHLDRRESLYRTLGITPLTLRGATVLEVAPGTGQNSLHVARLEPATLTLVEPNSAAVRDICALYATPGLSPTRPELVESRLEEYEPGDTFDLVICENWLGHSAHERKLLRKLGRLVADRGLLVVTTVDPVGALPNVLRKALALRLGDPAAPFAERTAVLCEAFGPHLRTLPAMTRTATDWVQDNVMNPAFLGVILPIPTVLADLGGRFDVLGSSPRFAADWRWFKSLCGEGREFNEHVLCEYHQSLHNFFDHRRVLAPRDPDANRAFEAAAWDLAERVGDLERSATGQAVRALVDSVQRVLAGMTDLPGEWSAALGEFLDVFADTNLTPDRVAGMERFCGLFGRETVYLSLEKQID